MKTLLVSDIFPPQTGGSGRWFWEIYSRMPRDQYTIAAGEDPRQAEFDEGHDLDLVRVPLRLQQWGVLGWSAFRGHWAVVRRLRKIIKARNIQRLHCGRCLPEGVAALALRRLNGTPYACYVHGEDINTAANSREYKFLVRKVLHNAEFVIANSRNTQQLLISDWGLPEPRVKLLHPGADVDRFHPADRNLDVRERLGWGDRPVVLTVGRLQKRKGHDQLIAALTKIREQVPHVLYCIIGDGEEREPLEAAAAALDLEQHVQFLGETSDQDLVHAYQQCDLFVLPNREIDGDIEGFGMVLLEAQACGKPVIAGASGGTAETMLDPETGRVIPCEAPDALATVVPELLLDPDRRAAMGTRGRRWVEEKFSWEALKVEARQLFEQ